MALKEVDLRSSSSALSAMREIQALRALGALSDPRIIRLLGGMVDMAVATLSLELCVLGSLRDWMGSRKSGWDAAAESHALAICLSGALALIHQEGWCHGDLKPSNILLRPGSAAAAPSIAGGGIAPVLADFGQSCRLSEVADHPCGSLLYCAPEALATQHSGGAPGDGEWPEVLRKLVQKLTRVRGFPSLDQCGPLVWCASRWQTGSTHSDSSVRLPLCLAKWLTQWLARVPRQEAVPAKEGRMIAGCLQFQLR